MSREFSAALLQLIAEKNIPREHLLRTIEEAIEAAYRRVAGNEDIQVRIDPETAKIRVSRARRVVAEVVDPSTEFSLEEARAHRPDAGLGDLIDIEQLDGDVFGRIGAQTAKQVVLQRLREAERDIIYDQFASREGELITGTVNRVEPRAIILDVGRGVEAILATTEQSATEHYRIGQNVKAYVLEVRRAPRGPQVLVSRTHKGFLRRLFELEVPEIHAGTVEIRAIAREAGSRSKVGVASRQEGLDPVGATVGQRGARVQAVVAELSGEKIDVIPWADNPALFVANALSPAQVVDVRIDEEHRIANVTVPERMLSLAIGREGQNARLAAKLTGWRIDIRSDVAVAEAARTAATTEAQPETAPTDVGPSAPVVLQRTTADVRATTPELGQSEAAESAARKPAGVAPETGASEASEPEANASEASQPGALEPESTDQAETIASAEGSVPGRPGQAVAKPPRAKTRSRPTSARSAPESRGPGPVDADKAADPGGHTELTKVETPSVEPAGSTADEPTEPEPELAAAGSSSSGSRRTRKSPGEVSS